MKLRMIKYGNLMFKAICPICGEPVTPDESIFTSPAGAYVHQANANCPTHGRVEMPPYAGEIEVK
jgi:hypothetical protein